MKNDFSNLKYIELFQLTHSDLTNQAFEILRHASDAEFQVFSLSDCAKIDIHVRGKTKNLPILSANDIVALRDGLNRISTGYRRAAGWSRNATLSQQTRKAEKITELCNRLISELLIEGTSDPDMFSLDLVWNRGLFESANLHIGKLINAVQTIELQAKTALMSINALHRSDDPPSDERGRSFDLRYFWLFAKLAVVYRSTWGNGRLPVSRRDAQGGPSVRFFQCTVKKVTGNEPTPDAVHDYLRKYLVGKDSSSIRF